MFPAREKRFLRINFVSVITLFALILAGGIVRSTGSGMGCPDWPKCFDQYVPPTQEAQLPADYQQKYVERRVAKNERIASILQFLGFDEIAGRIRNDKSILKPEEFNALKTYIEYINRLIGAVYGLLLIGCVIFATTYLRTRRKIFFWSVFNLILVGLQGWLGSVVVSTNLLSWVVTVHMLLAVAILAISIYTYFLARVWRDRNLLSNQTPGLVKVMLAFSLLVTLLQITLGTTVREQVDAIASAMDNLNRSEWVATVGLNFILHRDLALLVLVLNIAIFILIRVRYAVSDYQFKYAAYVLILTGLQILVGIVLSKLALPPVAQASHILLATLLFAAQFYLLLLLAKNKIYSRKAALPR